MVIAIRPVRGGFLRPFGCGWFIREFLLGHGPEGSPVIDPKGGACQEDIFYHYKLALHKAYAEEAVAWENEERIKRGKSIYTPEEYEERVTWFLSRIPYKFFKCRYHSFQRYFHRLKQLGWVEFTGVELALLIADERHANRLSSLSEMTVSVIVFLDETQCNFVTFKRCGM